MKRREAAQRADELRRRGFTWEQIAGVFHVDEPGIGPRVAFRKAHGLSHQDVADRWNTLTTGEPTMVKSRIYQFERWPSPESGRRPSAAALDMLARIYKTTGRRLLTDTEYGLYSDSARGEINLIDHRSLDSNQPSQRPSSQISMHASSTHHLTETIEERNGTNDQIDQRRLAEAVSEPRYFDSSAVALIHRQLDRCKSADGRLGAVQALPSTLSVLEVIQTHARDLRKEETRRRLLVAGADGAEFAAWLYRDLQDSNAAQYWLDRATEFAQEAGNLPMQGYVLLKKSQMAYEERDAVRTLAFAQAARYGPWQLPPKVLVEVLQQEARGHAMLGESFTVIERTLDQARSILNSTVDNGEPKLGSYYDENTFLLRTASCFIEAGKPYQAADLFNKVLESGTLSWRDEAYFRARRAVALALSGEPDDAAQEGVAALYIATAIKSERTARELRRAVKALAPWESRPAPRDLRTAMKLHVKRPSAD
ncbi:hypothetical protein [Sinosporangium album]|nr:hypothetical protein [Sinosporangium album]